MTLPSALLIFFALFLFPSFAGNPPEKPEILAREGWGATAAIPDLMQKQATRAIVIHHTSVRQQPKVSLEKKMRGLQQFSMAPGKVGKNNKPAWGDVPYHFYIDAAGAIAEGRDIAFSGDSNTKYDTQDKIQIVLEGHFDQEKPSDGQLKALLQLVLWLTSTYKIEAKSIVGHNDFTATDCPGKNLKPFLRTLHGSVNEATGNNKNN